LEKSKGSKEVQVRLLGVEGFEGGDEVYGWKENFEDNVLWEVGNGREIKIPVMSPPHN